MRPALAGGNYARPRGARLQNGDARADRQAQQGAATDARAVGEDVPEFPGRAGGVALGGFEEESEEQHREACEDDSAAIAEAEAGGRGERQGGAEARGRGVD